MVGSGINVAVDVITPPVEGVPDSIVSGSTSVWVRSTIIGIGEVVSGGG